MGNAKPFWEYADKIEYVEVAEEWAQAGLLLRCFETKERVRVFALRDVTLKAQYDDMKPVLKEIETLGLVQHSESYGFSITRPPNGTGGKSVTFFDQNTYLNLYFNGKNRTFHATGATTDEDILAQLNSIFDTYCEKISRQGSLYGLVQGSNGIELRSIGNSGETFIPENYRPEVVEAYRHIVSDLKNSDPCGRLAILDGIPGSGKSHMVRALMNEVPTGTFVIVPPNMISSLGSPGLLPALMDSGDERPIVLILEDADEALSSRKADNVSAISALLNLSDGLMGAVLDIRILATTNQSIEDFDTAVMRDGRLCRRVEIGTLDHIQAEAVYRRLTETAVESGHYTKGFHTLASVYRLARKGDAKEDSVAGFKKPTGFRSARKPMGFTSR